MGDLGTGTESGSNERRGRGVALARGRSTAVAIVWVATIAALVLSGALMSPVRALGLATAGPVVSPADVADLIYPLVLATLGAVLVMRGQAGWYAVLIMLTGFWAAVVGAAEEYALLARYGDTTLPFGDLAAFLQESWLVYFASFLLWLPALFPDGRAVGRWRHPVRIATVLWIVFTVTWLVADRQANNLLFEMPGDPWNPLPLLPYNEDVGNTVWGLLSIASLVIAAGALRARWRASGREGRQQLTWVLLALGISVGAGLFLMFDTLLVEVVGVDLGLADVAGFILAFSWVLVSIALGLGVLRYRLYQVNLVANRTVVYGVMTVLVIAGYASLVVGIPPLLGFGASGASLLATVVVAVAFAPVRARVQAGVNHRLFGRRDDPVGVLTELGDLMTRSTAPDATLASLAETAASSLKLPGVAIDLSHDDGFVRRVVHGQLGDALEVIPLQHSGDEVGRMVVARRSPSESLHAEDHRLLGNIAVHAAALAHALRLNLALQRSREQLVLAREEERRRLRRDLHDGLGPTLASQTFRMDAIIGLIERDPNGAVAEVRSLKDVNKELVADIRRLVYELRPPALDELGLAGALAAHAGQLAGSGLEVEVVTEPEPLAPLPAAVEVAAYRIAREAVTNVVRHAKASHCEIRLRAEADTLTVEVTDDGVGIRNVTAAGVGLTSMRERADELGGSVLVAPRLDAPGTTVAASLPVVSPAPKLRGQVTAAAASGSAALSRSAP